MALRDQPYIPLYIQDFLTDEKLIECSAHATGVYVRLMCIMHKSEDYGKILLKQKDKQTNDQLKNFALKIAKQMPYSFEVVSSSLTELLTEKVIHIEGDFLCQKRMIKDNLLSLARSQAGHKGGKLAQAKLKAKPKASTENEIEYVNEDKNEIEDEILNEYSNWTNSILDRNDFLFWNKFRNEQLPESDNTDFWIRDHLDLLNRYPKMRPPNQGAFRNSCLKHIRENYKKQINGTGKQHNGLTKVQQQQANNLQALRDQSAAVFGKQQ